MKFLAMLLGAIVLSGCASTGVVQTDSGTYMIGKKSAQIGFGPPDSTEAEVYREANRFCAKKHEGVETVKLKVTNSSFAQPGDVLLQFRCKK